MQSSFRPLSQIPAEMALQYFATQGYSPETVQWKYFDTAFNRGRERGYGWLQNEGMRGFIGLIPFLAARGMERVKAAWACDWALEPPNVKGGVGVMLIWQAFRSYPVLFGLGGNERSQAIFPRMATKTFQGAGTALYLPLRLGAALRILPRLIPSFRPESLQQLGRVPIRRLPVHPKEPQVMIEQGVSPAIAALLELASNGASWVPHYDFEYVTWQIGRCPNLACFTAHIPSAEGPRAACLFWHLRKSTSYWRMALIRRDEDEDQAAPLVSGTARYVYGSGGDLLAALVSRHDTGLVETLKAAGFLAAPNKRSLYALSGKNKPLPVDEFQRLSYLDTDLAHFL